MSDAICSKGGYTLVRPFNNWDMNYHLYDGKGKDYLIDIDDVYSNEKELDEYGGILWDNLSTLSDIDEAKSAAWKVNEVEEDSTQIWDVLTAI